MSSLENPYEGRDRDELDELKDLLTWNPRTEKQDYIHFQARCVRKFGAAAGIMARQFVFLTNLSRLEGGWFWKTREEGCEETGLGHREWDKGKQILLGKRPWAGRTVKVLEEQRPNRRGPTEYRVDLIALAEILGVEVPPSLVGDESTDLDEFGGLPRYPPLVATPAAAPPRGAAEPPRGTTEPPHRASESPQRATESLHRGATESPRAGQPQREPSETSSKEPTKATPEGRSGEEKTDPAFDTADGDEAPRSSMASPDGSARARLGKEQAASREDDHVRALIMQPSLPTNDAEGGGRPDPATVARVCRLLDNPASSSHAALRRSKDGEIDAVALGAVLSEEDTGGTTSVKHYAEVAIEWLEASG